MAKWGLPSNLQNFRLSNQREVWYQDFKMWKNGDRFWYSSKRYFDFQRCLLGEDFWSTILTHATLSTYSSGTWLPAQSSRQFISERTIFCTTRGRLWNRPTGIARLPLTAVPGIASKSPNGRAVKHSPNNQRSDYQCSELIESLGMEPGDFRF